MHRTLAMLVLASLVWPAAASAQREVRDVPVGITAVNSEMLENLPRQSVAQLLEYDLTGLAVLDPGTAVATSLRGNYFVTDQFAVTGRASVAHVDLGLSDITAVEVLVGGQYLAQFGQSASAGVVAMIGYQDANVGDGDGIYELGAVTRVGAVPGAALYTGLFVTGAFGGGESWSIRSELIPAKYPSLRGTTFVPRKGVWELDFTGSYQIDPGDFLDLSARAAPFLTHQIQVGVDLNFQRDGSGTDDFTTTTIQGFAAYHVPTNSRLLPYLGAFGGYQSVTDFDGEAFVGPRAGLKYSCFGTSSLFLEGDYRVNTGEFTENEFVLRLGTNVYAGF